MNEKAKPTDIPQVSCDVCLKEVPKSEAMFSEAQDYVTYFCGVDCYDRWLKEKDTKQEGADK